MATIRIDSELITNYVSTVPVPAGSHHVTVLDQKRMPMVFCLSNDRPSPRLQILRRDAEGHSQLFDIHDLIGLPKDAYVQTFHVEQSWDLRLHLAVAYGDRKGSNSYLHLMKPFAPEVLRQSDDALPHIPGKAQFGTIQKILMAPLSGTNSNVVYPDIFLIHQDPDQTISWGKDIWHIQVQPRFRSWSASKELDTPENVSEILDIAPASSSYGQGLYITQGKTKLYARYIRPDPNATDGTQFTFTTPVSCPEGARCIASLSNNKGYGGLLIAASDGIRYLTVSDATSRDRLGKLIFTDEILKNLRHLHLCQDQNNVAIWFRNNKDELGYIRTKDDSVAEASVCSLLLSPGLSSSFSAAITAPNSYTGQAVRQMVVSNDQSGNLMLIEQTADIGLWRKTPFYQPSSNEPTPLKSYTITMKARDDKGNSLSSGSVRVSASSSISIILNGRNHLLTTVPMWLDCDPAGNLDFIIPNDSLGSQKLIIDQVRCDQGKILPFTRTEYDASAKPMQLLDQKLEGIKSLDQFKNLKTQSGEDLFEGDVKSDEALMKNAHGCLQSLLGTRTWWQALFFDLTSNQLPGSTKSDEATKFWESFMAPEIAKLGAAMSQLGQDITMLFMKNGSINGDDIIKVSKSIVKAGIASVRAIVIGLLRLVKVFVQKLSELGNAEINIPIVSWVYKKISLIIAIPTTIFAKLITGKAPPTFASMDAKLIEGLIEGKGVPDSTKTDWTIFCGEVVVGITLTSGAVSLIKLLYKSATQGLDDVLDELDEGPSSLFDVFGIVVDIIGSLMAIPEQNDMPGGCVPKCSKYL
ncbi:uncharacterized protein FFB14_06274 [Fusarium fujikuroi]|nr:uncharacterized protein FFB14_06274 [Fusarium fujikuroi]